MLPQLVQVPVGQLGDDDQFAGDDLDAIDREQERMADRLDELEGAQLFLGVGAVVVEAVEASRRRI